MKHFQIGVELFTLREELSQDFKGVFRDLSKLGIDLVEPAFFYGGMEPAEYRAFLKELNLSVRSIYAPQVSDLLTADSEAARFASELNVPYLTVGSGLDFAAEWLRLAQELRTAVAANLAMGRRTLYHNHHHEFDKNENGEYLLDLFLAETLKEPGLEIEPDIGWIAKANVDYLDFVRRYASRIPIIHLRDISKNGETFAALGRGTLDIPACLEILEKSPCDALIYEQDSFEDLPWDSTVKSVEFLKKLVK